MFQKDCVTRDGGVLLALQCDAVQSCERLYLWESTGENLGYCQIEECYCSPSHRTMFILTVSFHSLKLGGETSAICLIITEKRIIQCVLIIKCHALNSIFYSIII